MPWAIQSRIYKSALPDGNRNEIPTGRPVGVLVEKEHFLPYSVQVFCVHGQTRHSSTRKYGANLKYP